MLSSAHTPTVPVVRVQRWSRAAAHLCAPPQVVIGWVHSCYARIINVRTPAGRLLTLQGLGPLQAPLAASLNTDVEVLSQRLAPRALIVHDSPATAAYPAALRLRCAEAVLWDGHLSPQPSCTPAGRPRMADTLSAWLYAHAPDVGLAPLLAALEHGRPCQSPIHTAMHTTLAPLLASPPFSAQQLLMACGQLLGLGEGLTPSGDDLLVGLFAVLHVTGWLTHGLPVTARHLLLCDMTRGTSHLSSAFLHAALSGDFAEPLVTLMHSLWALETGNWQAPAAALAAVGHSSGVDAMVGVILGCRLLAK